MAAVLSKRWQTLLGYSTTTLPCVLRFCSSQAKPSCKAASSHLLWSSKVSSFGKLSIIGGIEAVDLHVKPCSVYATNWKEGQEQVSAFLVSRSQDARRVIEGELNDILECEVSDESDEHEHSPQSIVNINVYAGNSDHNCKPSLRDASRLLIEVPHFFHLNIKWSSSSKITVEKLEGDVRVRAVGDCVLSHLKSPSITVCTTHGSITGQSSLIGDTALTTGKGGDVNIDKLQGNNIKIDCRDGRLQIKSLYGGNTVMSSTSGEIHVGDAHGNVNVSSSSGNVTVESICGLLTAVLRCGDLDAKMTAGGNIDAACANGNTTIKIDDNLRCDLDFRAKTIDISRDLDILEKSERLDDELVTVCGQSEGLGEQRVHVNCPKGHLKLLRESWFVLPNM